MNVSDLPSTINKVMISRVFYLLSRVTKSTMDSKVKWIYKRIDDHFGRERSRNEPFKEVIFLMVILKISPHLIVNMVQHILEFKVK